MSKSGQIFAAAQKGARPAALAARDIGPDFVTQALADILAARAKSTEAVTDTTGTRTATVAEVTSAKKLMVGLQEAQAAAKQKYARTQPEKLQDYCVGKKAQRKPAPARTVIPWASSANWARTRSPA